MASATVQNDNVALEDPKVITAVEFLGDVYEKGHKEGELRKYLFNRRELTHSQVERAFKLHYERIEARKAGNSRGTQWTETERTVGATTNTPNSGNELGVVRRKSKEFDGKNDADRPEVTQPQLAEVALAFLEEIRRTDGQKLIRDFLRTELNYCGVLRCLQDEYYKALENLSHQKKIGITGPELRVMFDRIPNLLNFHKVFYKNLVKDHDHIGQMFVRVINHFKEYVEYMKDSSKMVDLMRKYVTDRKLHKCLSQIRMQSRRKNDDMVDLLLVPLDRILDYQIFLDKLYLWADKAQREDYINLGKAARRIGRIAHYIGIYRDGILNRNEMNKVQQFLKRQCNILAPSRRMVRRGAMTRRTNGWPTRKKKYLFFLFSDLLIWTSKKGDLQNVVRLRDCKVYPSEERNNPEKKFKIISTGQHRVLKEILLECDLQRQRNDWFNAIKRGIEEIQKVSDSKEMEKMSTEEEDFVKFLALDVNTPPGDKELDEDAKMWENDDSRVESSVVDDSDDQQTNARHRYRCSQNFPNHAFPDVIAQMDDNVSIVSENDQDAILGLASREKYGSSMEQLFPNMIIRSSKPAEKKVNGESSSIFSEAYSTEIPGTSQRSMSNRTDGRVAPYPNVPPPINESSVGERTSPSLSIIRKGRHGSNTPDIRSLQHSSSFSLLLVDTE